MKKIIFALSLLLLCSCSYLDVVPEGKATEAPKAESKADVKAEVKAEKTEAKPKVEKDYGEDNPNPRLLPCGAPKLSRKHSPRCRPN